MGVHRLSDELHDDCRQIILYIPHLILILVLQELNNYHPGGAIHPSYHNPPSGGGLACYPAAYLFFKQSAANIQL
ncbi:MAG: hypothetical protein PVJ11_10095 [Syntrophobacterales bacterium]